MSKRSTADRNRCRGIEARAIALLERYDCPTPYHAVCTHFLGAMSGSAPVQPMKVLATIWGGALPAFPSIDAVNDLLEALVAQKGRQHPGVDRVAHETVRPAAYQFMLLLDLNRAAPIAA